MPPKGFAQKFDKIDKKSVKGKVKHSRTGACTAKGKCFHGKAKHN